MPKSSCLYIICAVVLALDTAQAASHTFQPNEPVKLYANKVGPFSNPRCFSTGQLENHRAATAIKTAASTSDMSIASMCTCSETYQYYDLPFCRTPDGLEHKPETLGEVGLHMSVTSWLAWLWACTVCKHVAFGACTWCSFLHHCEIMKLLLNFCHVL